MVDFLTCGMQMFPPCFSLVVVPIHLLSEKQRPHPPTRLFLFFVYSIKYLGLNKDGITLFSEKVEAVYIYCMWAGDSS